MQIIQLYVYFENQNDRREEEKSLFLELLQQEKSSLSARIYVGFSSKWILMRA